MIQRVGAAAGTALMAVVLQSSGFVSALTWMLVLTVAGIAGTVLLPGSDPNRAAGAPATRSGGRDRDAC